MWLVMTSDFPAQQKILATFFLVADKRAQSTLICQDLCRRRLFVRNVAIWPPGAVPVGHQLRLAGIDSRRRPSLPSGTYGPVERPATLSLIHISEPTRLGMISYAVFCL